MRKGRRLGEEGGLWQTPQDHRVARPESCSKERFWKSRNRFSGRCEENRRRRRRTREENSKTTSSRGRAAATWLKRVSREQGRGLRKGSRDPERNGLRGRGEKPGLFSDVRSVEGSALNIGRLKKREGGVEERHGKEKKRRRPGDENQGRVFRRKMPGDRPQEKKDCIHCLLF